jgi:hypothetical protein
MKYSCCLCDAVLGEFRPGRIPDGGGVPLCDEHRASSAESARRYVPAVVVLPLSADDQYIRNCVAAALAGAPSVSLSDCVRPVGTTLQ